MPVQQIPTNDVNSPNEIALRPLTRSASAVMTLTLAGFFAVSYIPGALETGSRVATVPFRGLVLALIIYTGYRYLEAGYLRMRMSVISLLVLFFWTAYCTRFVADGAVLQVPLGQPPWYMALYLFGICVPTFTVLYLIRDISLYRKALVWTMLPLGACCLASAFLPQATEQVSGAGHKANEILNHIGYGHMGVTTVVLALFVLLKIGGRHRPWYLRLLAAGAVCLGVFTLMAAVSRGAVVAGILVIPVALYLGLRLGSRLLAIVTVVALGFVLSVTAAYLSRKGEQVVRLVASASAYSSAHPSIYGRQTMLRDAWHEYLTHPWLGSSIVERNTLSYPHNAIVEAFMATGTFGGAALTLLVIIAVYRARIIIRRDPEMAWLPLCFLQYLTGAMFSGGLWDNVILWGLMAVMLGVEKPRTPRRKVAIEYAA